MLTSVPTDSIVLASEDNSILLEQVLDGITITLKADEGVFPADAVLSVDRIEEVDKVDKTSIL